MAKLTLSCRHAW